MTADPTIIIEGPAVADYTPPDGHTITGFRTTYTARVTGTSIVVRAERAYGGGYGLPGWRIGATGLAFEASPVEDVLAALRREAEDECALLVEAQ